MNKDVLERYLKTFVPQSEKKIMGVSVQELDRESLLRVITLQEDRWTNTIRILEEVDKKTVQSGRAKIDSSRN